MKKFEEPIIEVVKLAAEDVITTSNPGYTPDPDEGEDVPLT